MVTLGIIGLISSAWLFAEFDLDQCIGTSQPSAEDFTLDFRRLRTPPVIECPRADFATNVERVLTHREHVPSWPGTVSVLGMVAAAIMSTASAMPWATLWAMLAACLGLLAATSAIGTRAMRAIFHWVAGAALWWGSPFIWVLIVPVVTVPLIGSQVPFRIVSGAYQQPPIVETVSPLGRSTAECYFDSFEPHTPAATYRCPTTRPLNTHIPALLYLVAGVWMLSSRPRTYKAAQLALGIGALQALMPILLDLHDVSIICGPSPCGIGESSMAMDLIAGVMGWLFSIGAIAAFLDRRDQLPPSPVLARGATDGSDFERPTRRK